jgi:uncharacterized protein YdaU (DUF1376 family)
MNVVSFTEDIWDRLIEEVQQVRSNLNAPDTRPEKSEAHLKACEAVCDELISKLQRAKEIAADPDLGRAFRIDFLQIENARLHREIERIAKGLTRVQAKFAEHRLAGERDRDVHAARGAQADKQIRSLLAELKAKKKAIAHFDATHRAPPKNRPSSRGKRRR